MPRIPKTLQPAASTTSPATGLRLRRRAALFAILPCLALMAPMVLAADTIEVSQRNRRFSPDALTVAPGTVLHIMNDDNVTHHIFVDQPTMHFDSGEQPIGTTVDLRFDHAGSFDVQCAIHPTMHLQVKVQ